MQMKGLKVGMIVAPGYSDDQVDIYENILLLC